MKTNTITAIIIFCCIVTSAQSGGTFEIKQSTIASGGGQGITGGSVDLAGTAGQPAAAKSSGGPFTLAGGLFPSQALAPTAARVAISGRVRTADGAGIRSVRVTLADASGGPVRQALTGPFGYYKFDDVTVGETYLLTVSSKRYTFDPNTRLVSLMDEVADADWTASPVPGIQ
jgi:hypothetical protein